MVPDFCIYLVHPSLEIRITARGEGPVTQVSAAFAYVMGFTGPGQQCGLLQKTKTKTTVFKLPGVFCFALF